MLAVMMLMLIEGKGSATGLETTATPLQPGFISPKVTGQVKITDELKSESRDKNCPTPVQLYIPNTTLTPSTQTCAPSIPKPTPIWQPIQEQINDGFEKFIADFSTWMSDYDLRVIISAVVVEIVFLGGILVSLLALFGWWQNNWKRGRYAFWSLFALPVSLVGFILLTVTYPPLILGVFLLVIGAGILGIVLSVINWFVRGTWRVLKKYGKILFDFAAHSDERLINFNLVLLHSLKAWVTLQLARHPIAEELAAETTLKVFYYLNLNDFLLGAFLALAGDVRQPMRHRLDALHWIGRMADSIPVKDRLDVEGIASTLLSFAEDRSQADSFRSTAAYMLLKRTRIQGRQRTHKRTSQVFRPHTAQRAWLSLAETHPLTSPLLRVQAIQNLYQHFHDHRTAYAILQTILDRKNGDHLHDELKVRAAWLLGLMASPEQYDLVEDRKKALDFLRHYAGSLDCKAEVRFLAAYALGRLGEADEAGPFLYALATQLDISLRHRAIKALFRLRQQDHLVKLASNNAWKMGMELKMRQRAIEFLNRLNADVGACHWADMAEDTSLLPIERIRAAFKSLQDKDPRGRDVLLAMGEDPQQPGNQRLMAADYLARCGYLEEARQVYLLISHELRDAVTVAQARRELAHLHRYAGQAKDRLESS
jgi:hypothetical protein